MIDAGLLYLPAFSGYQSEVTRVFAANVLLLMLVDGITAATTLVAIPTMGIKGAVLSMEAGAMAQLVGSIGVISFTSVIAQL